MQQTLVRVTFESYEKWKAVFDESVPLRKAYGSRGVRVYRIIDKPNEVVILGEYEDLEKVRQLFQSQELREATKRAGVTVPPVVDFLDEEDRLPA